MLFESNVSLNISREHCVYFLHNNPSNKCFSTSKIFTKLVVLGYFIPYRQPVLLGELNGISACHANGPELGNIDPKTYNILSYVTTCFDSCWDIISTRPFNIILPKYE